MNLTFDHLTYGQRVRFGAGAAAETLAAEVERRGARRVMVLASSRGMALARAVAAGLGEKVAVWHDEVAEHVPVAVAERARSVASTHEVDLLVPVGGGSAIGTAKAIALTSGLPTVAVPTTYAGSEATAMWGMTEHGRKTTGIDARVLPGTVIYDSELTLSLPLELSVASGLNALAHCVDSLWAPGADPINAALAAEGARALHEGLRGIAADPTLIDARDHTLYGAYLAAVAFSSAGSGLHHKLCHILGGTFNLPHAQTHATVLPYVLAFNIDHAPDAARRLSAAFGVAGVGDAVEALNRLREDVGAPRALEDLGFGADGIAEVVAQALDVVPASNPRPVDEENLTRMLAAALTGEDPAVVRG